MTTNGSSDFWTRPELVSTRRTLDLASAVLAQHSESGTPLASFLDSRPSDLDDLASAVGATVEELVSVRDLLRCAYPSQYSAD